MPRRREPWKGETRQASPTWSPIPRPTAAGIEPVVGDLRLDLRPGERDHLRLLGRGERAAQLLEGGDPVDPIGIGARCGFDGERAEASQHRGHLGHDGIHRPARLVRSHVRIIAPGTDNSAAHRP